MAGNQRVLIAVRDVSADGIAGGCQSALVNKLGVSPSQYHHPWSTLQITWGWTKDPQVAADLRRQSRPVIASLPIYQVIVHVSNHTSAVITWQRRVTRMPYSVTQWYFVANYIHEHTAGIIKIGFVKDMENKQTFILVTIISLMEHCHFTCYVCVISYLMHTYN
jgi:hypothetical protein